MFCPKCGTENIEDAKFCRSCGANISLVPQALTGQLPPLDKGERFDWKVYYDYEKHKKRASLSHAVPKIFVGFAFLIIAVVLSFTQSWWFWLLIPALAMLGTGIGEILQVKSEQQKSLPPPQTQQQQMNFQPTPERRGELPPERNTTEFMTPPASVTEHTTRHLGAEVPTKVFSDKN